MIRLILVFLTLAKTAPNFTVFPRCKISNFSQDFQRNDHLFYFCEEKSKIAKRLKSANCLIMSEIVCFPFFANVFAVWDVKMSMITRTLIYNIEPSDDGYLYRFLFLNIRNVSDTGIAFSTKRIYVYPVFLLYD